MKDTLTEYRELMKEIDDWFIHAISHHPAQIQCKSGCSECCCSLFDITLLDAACLSEGFERLPEEMRAAVSAKANRRLFDLKERWPELDEPYILNYRREEDWQELMLPDDETPCVLLDDNNNCLLYEYRPMTCRLHGLPLIDLSGEVMHEEWCTKNFTCSDPTLLPELAAPFDDLFRREAALDRRYTEALLGETVFELDTFIPLALMLDFETFDWHGWWREHRSTILAMSAQGKSE